MKKLTTAACAVALAATLSTVPASATTLERLGDACRIDFSITERNLTREEGFVFTKDEAPFLTSQIEYFLSLYEKDLAEAPAGSEDAKKAEERIAIYKSALSRVDECLAEPADEEGKEPASESSSSSPWITALVGLIGAVIGGVVTAFGIVPALKEALHL
ncbi:hypothetical protein HMPREF3169_05240 [Corynebacterium sp. HMSC08C04]|uniref:hypothetical protein n=1 Tax=Corynebacterium sp. HMSC08C04 TaxID=1581137 RepID=UPI0008A12CD8|nr:hypothetical protein [Corynebacterium sp. HMSC08C04]OFT34648.1 hypothetical protein HMPREF3169_05240 [Corynebacterium sp. HMSC08C04]